MKKYIQLFVLAFVVLWPCVSSAEVVFSPGIYFQSRDKDKETFKFLNNDIRLGYKYRSYYIGGLYERERINHFEGNEDKRDGYGISLGYVIGDLSMMGTYMFKSKFEENSFVLEDGQGVRLDLDYRFMLTNRFGLGPRLTYKNISYNTKKLQPSDIQENQAIRHKVFEPGFSMIYIF
ncbi:MAG: hypothetical protein KUG78_02245 [Kangiellaceae bacterium]|nr:hypothetical protein [Kangiellaceae bacterium]